MRLAPSIMPTIRGPNEASMALGCDVRGLRELLDVKDIPFVARHAPRPREESASSASCRPTSDRADVVGGMASGLTPTLAKFKKYTGDDRETAGRPDTERGTDGRAEGRFISTTRRHCTTPACAYEIGGARGGLTKPGTDHRRELATMRGGTTSADTSRVDAWARERRSIAHGVSGQEELFAGKGDPLDKLLAPSRPRNYRNRDQRRRRGRGDSAEAWTRPRKAEGRPKAKL